MYWQCDFLGEWMVDLEGGTLPPPAVVPLPFQGRLLEGEGFGVEVRVGLGGGNPTTA